VRNRKDFAHPKPEIDQFIDSGSAGFKIKKPMEKPSYSNSKKHYKHSKLTR
jgi:hypothetical protein